MVSERLTTGSARRSATGGRLLGLLARFFRFLSFDNGPRFIAIARFVLFLFFFDDRDENKAKQKIEET